MFPITLSTLEFDTTASDNTFFNARAMFRYSHYEIKNLNNERRTMSDWNPQGT
jgi:hypothetical protein